LPESQCASLQVERSGAHGMRRTFGLLHLMTRELRGVRIVFNT
jgi:hypothetical protein